MEAQPQVIVLDEISFKLPPKLPIGSNTFFFTTCATKTVNEWQDALEAIGIKTTKDKVITSVTLTVAYMKTKHPEVKKAITFCSELLKKELELSGIECVSSHADCESYDTMMYNLKVDPTVGAVIIGHDSLWHYNHSVVSCIYLTAGCAFIATDRNRNRRLSNGRTIPSTAAFTDSVKLGLSETGGGVSKREAEVCEDYLIEYLR